MWDVEQSHLGAVIQKRFKALSESQAARLQWDLDGLRHLKHWAASLVRS